MNSITDLLHEAIAYKAANFEADEDYESKLEHWSSPNGCHADCPACADEAKRHDPNISGADLINWFAAWRERAKAVLQTAPHRKPIEEQVCDSLCQLGVPCTFEYPGFIRVVNHDQGAWDVGTTNPNWGADYTEPNGDFNENRAFELEISSEHQDAPAIAAAIKAALEARDYHAL